MYALFLAPISLPVDRREKMMRIYSVDDEIFYKTDSDIFYRRMNRSRDIKALTSELLSCRMYALFLAPISLHVDFREKMMRIHFVDDKILYKKGSECILGRSDGSRDTDAQSHRFDLRSNYLFRIVGIVSR